MVAAVAVGERNLNCTDVKLRIGMPAVPLSLLLPQSGNGRWSIPATGIGDSTGVTDSSVVWRTVRAG